MKFVLRGEPKSTNTLYRSVCTGRFPRVYMTNTGKVLKESYQWQLKEQYRGAPITGLITVAVEFYFGTKRKCDIDNFNKILFDAFSGIVWEDDSQIARAIYDKGYDAENPRIEVRISNFIAKQINESD